MNTTALVSVVVLCLCSPARHAWGGEPTEVRAVSGFGRVSIYAPQSMPSQVVLFVSGDGGWNLGVIPMAEALRDLGALVIGIDIRAFVDALNGARGCAYPGGELERLSRDVQLHRSMPEYKPPILVGYSSGATLVYAAVAAAPEGTFAGAISLGFCPDLEIHRPLCLQNGLSATARSRGPGFELSPNSRMRTPWVVLQGEIDQVCAPAVTAEFLGSVPAGRLVLLPRVGHGFAVPRNWEAQFVAAFDALAVRRGRDAPVITALEVRDLPLVEVPASRSSGADTMAIIFTGDGGWADLDKRVAEGLAARGVPSVGWSSLSYFWTPRTPDGTAADLARVINYYVSHWSVDHVILIGYSFGANVLPFLVNRLPPAVAAHVRSVALLGPSDNAEFEFHVSDWIGRSRASPYQTVAEIERLTVPVVCIRGTDEDDSICRSLNRRRVTSRAIGVGHHFSARYEELVDAVLAVSR